MNIGVLKETKNGETRVAAVPETVVKYIAQGFNVLVESGAGKASGFDDEEYIKSGAAVLKMRADVMKRSDFIFSIRRIPPQDYPYLRPGQILAADYETARYPEEVRSLAAKGVTVLALERMPRISRAQSMDILSSQNNLAGYKAALLGMNALNRGVPLMITAAGTIPPAKCLVLGAGVAGLQAVATLKRMGAVVYASDVRAAAKEQVESLGGNFLLVDETADFENKSGYASEISAEYLMKQKEMVAEQLKQTDILITTALSAGKKAPLLVTSGMLGEMPENAAVIDMAGGNVELNLSREDLKIVQDNNLAALVPHSASRLFSRNILNLLEAYGGGSFRLDLKDEILAAICVCHNGKVLAGN